MLNADNGKLKLREEELIISKELIQTAEVSVRKEIITEEKTITVPIIREEIVIEKRVLRPNSKDNSNEHTEVIRIPLCEEEIEVIKHPVVLEDVEIYRHQFEEINSVQDILKKRKTSYRSKRKCCSSR